jgi:hypothetical protein
VPVRLLFLALVLAAPRAPAPADAVDDAAALVAADRYAEAAVVLAEHHKREPGDARSHRLYGDALFELARLDEAAHHYDLALARMDESREAKALRARLVKADPLTASREAWFKKLARTAADAAEQLVAGGHHERALELLERTAPFAPASAGKDTDRLLALLAAERARNAQVDLDEAGGPEVTEARPLVEVESEHYLVSANLEREVAELVGRTMDDIFASYVQVYFDGDAAKVSTRKATIRIHPDHATMMTEWSDPSRSVGGWWSPGEWRVTCYDTRSDSGTLEGMLETLFHEASHQFMTMRSKGGGAPSWLNEGTATFFEGATAMSDGRVLWPEAAVGRLSNLASMLRGKTGPSARKVVEYSEPASYPGDHYAFGWGLVYFLQQWEDPRTLEYAWRPYYLDYLENVTTRGGDSMQLFGELILAKGNPGGFAGFDEFAAEWERWILDVVYPLQLGRDARELRWAELRRYVAAADAVAGKNRAAVPEAELLLRAVGAAQKLRESEDGKQPDLALRRQEIELYQRLGQPATAAARIEELLELAAAELVSLDEAELDELDGRMKKLDAKNYPLRSLRAKNKGLERGAESLLARYEKRRDPLLLRSWSFARAAATALDDEGELFDASERLRAAARAAGLVPSRVLRVAGKTWESIFSTRPPFAEKDGGNVEVEMPALQAAEICADVAVAGEYELRARLERIGELFGSSYHGFVIRGGADGDWLALLFDREGRVVLRRVERSPGGGTTSRTIAMELLYPALAPDESPDVAIRVTPDGRLRVTVGERAPLKIEVPAPLDDLFRMPGHVGYYVIDGRLRLSGFVVEIFP